MNLLTLVKSAKAFLDAIKAEPRDWGVIVSTGRKLLLDLLGEDVPTFGATDGDMTVAATELKAAMKEIVAIAPSLEGPVESGDTFGKIGDGKLIELIVTVAPLILKWLRINP